MDDYRLIVGSLKRRKPSLNLAKARLEAVNGLVSVGRFPRSATDTKPSTPIDALDQRSLPSVAG